ncbi:unnamed protein product [Mytilus edulis]|uniref:Uncharacterized protein n=1 Tax=Mytilus edulis TaxID=6550 RepID=A0A8S3Q144_MYTED|nr:unnamed protein product [Mytilus edulis]
MLARKQYDVLTVQEEKFKLEVEKIKLENEKLKLEIRRLNQWEIQEVKVKVMLLITRMKSFGLTRNPFSDINDDDLEEIVMKIKQNHPNDGEALMDGYLKARTPPIKIKRWRLRAAVHFKNRAWVQARRTVTIKRRHYSSGPQYLWHIDGHHKLIK